MKKLAFGALFVGLIAACGGKNPVHLVDAPAGSDAGSDTGECNVLTQMGCAAGQKCTWVIDQEMPTELGHVGCAPDGNVDLGGACMYGAPGATGYDNCKQGTVCLGGVSAPGVCKQLCDQNGGAPMCDTNHSCQVYDGLLGPSGMEAAGVCDPLCNPLDDNDFDGSGSAFTKTGSGCSAAEGCFGFWSGDTATHFSCSHFPNPTLFNASPCTPDNNCETMDGTGAYINGCAAGYVPMYIQPVGSTTITCQAYCKPAECSKGNCGSNNINETGADPHRCANADAKGNFTGDSCIYGWLLAEFSHMGSGALAASPYLDGAGICFPRSSFMLGDSTGMNSSTTPWPVCSSMEASGTGSNCYGAYMGSAEDLSGCYAADFGCLNTTDSGVMTAFKNARKHLRVDFRFPYHQLSPKQ